MYPENYLLYLQIILFLFITPGSPRVLIVSYSMTYGVKKSAWMAFGDITANSIQMIVVTFIIGSVLLAYPQIMIIMKWLGVIYLTYLAYELFRSKVKNFSSSNEKIAKTKKPMIISTGMASLKEIENHHLVNKKNLFYL